MGGIAYRSAGSLYRPKPRFVCFPVTFRCNSRCQMCNLWRERSGPQELSLEEIERVFANRLFGNIEEMVLHGGEPTLRRDLKDIFGIVFDSCPVLRSVTLSTNGLEPELVDGRIAEVLNVAGPRARILTVTVSIDGLEEAHDKIRGIAGGFARALETLDALRKRRERFPIDVKIITVIQPQNLGDLEGMKNLADARGVDIIFQPLMIDTFYKNSSADPRLRFSGDQLRDYREFIRKSLRAGRSPRSLVWKNHLGMMAGRKRAIPCAYDRYVLSLYPTGEVLPCSREDWILFGNVREGDVDRIWFGPEARAVRKRMKKEVCPTCDFYCGAEYSLKKEFFTYCGFYLGEALRPSAAEEKSCPP